MRQSGQSDNDESEGFRAVLSRADFPAFSLVDQPHLIRSGIGTQSLDEQLTAVSISFNFILEPEAEVMAVNYVDNIDEVNTWIRSAVQSGKPASFVYELETLRYPQLVSAVTSANSTQFDTLAATLSVHMSETRANAPRQVYSPEEMAKVRAEGVERGVATETLLIVDGALHPGLKLETSEYNGYAFEVSNAYITTVLPTHVSPVLKLEWMHLL